MGARYSRNSGYTIARRSTATRPTVRTVQRKVKFGPTTAKILGLGVLAVIAIVMLSSSSKSNTSLYQQKEIRQNVSQVNQDIERLKLEAKRAQSLQEIQKTPLKDQMQPVDNSAGYVEKGDVAGVSTEAP